MVNEGNDLNMNGERSSGNEVLPMLYVSLRRDKYVIISGIGTEGFVSVTASSDVGPFLLFDF